MANRSQQSGVITFGTICKWTFTAILVIVAIGVGMFAFYCKSAPNVSQSQLQAAGSSALYTKDGKLLLSLGADKRNYVKYDELPEQLKDAIVSIEDKDYWNEKWGINPLRIAASSVRNLRGNGMAGGSTITQQLVKLSVFSTNASDRTLKRKAQEAYLAVKISQQYSKQQILEFYCNKTYMNFNQYGMGTASSYYYGKPLNKLDLAQTALIAGLPNAPAAYNPYLYPSKAKWRRDLVLKAMLKNNKISQEQYNQAVNESITKGLRTKHPTGTKQRLIDDPYIKEVVNEVQKDGFDPYRDNLKITVNIDQKAQNKLYELANNDSVKFTNNKMQIGATIVDPSNGHVVAILGGRHLPKIQMALDRAVQTDRSTGSSIKPVLDYAPAIEYKYWSTAHIVQDTPYTYKGTSIKLYDWDNRYEGAMTMRYALEQSRNVPAVRTLEDVGLHKGADFAKKMGVNVDPRQGLSVAIGANASSLQMAGAFGAFANKGVYHKPQFVSKIEAPDGLTRNYDNSGTRVMRESTAYMITDMLKDVITKGSGKKARLSDVYAAGKTGTVKYSDGELSAHPEYKDTPKDSWFVGYTQDYVISVWTGYDKLNEGTIDKTGQDTAQLFYKEAMKYMMKDKTSVDWDKPDSVVEKKYKGGNVITTELWVKGHAPNLDDSVVDDSKNKNGNIGDKKSNSQKTRSNVVQRTPDDSDKKQSQNSQPSSSQKESSNNSEQTKKEDSGNSEERHTDESGTTIVYN